MTTRKQVKMLLEKKEIDGEEENNDFEVFTKELKDFEKKGKVPTLEEIKDLKERLKKLEEFTCMYEKKKNENEIKKQFVAIYSSNSIVTFKNFFNRVETNFFKKFLDDEETSFMMNIFKQIVLCQLDLQSEKDRDKILGTFNKEEKLIFYKCFNEELKLGEKSYSGEISNVKNIISSFSEILGDYISK